MSSRERKHLLTNIHTDTFRFMRAWKKQNPDSYCHLQFDKLYIDNRLYVWDKESGEVRTLFSWSANLGRILILLHRWWSRRAILRVGRPALALDLHQVFSGADSFLSS